jgi:hypothetical protein
VNVVSKGHNPIENVAYGTDSATPKHTKENKWGQPTKQVVFIKGPQLK